MHDPVAIEAERLIGVRGHIAPPIEQFAYLNENVDDLAFGTDRHAKLKGKLADDVIGHGRFNDTAA
jgi:hypothetical protein